MPRIVGCRERFWRVLYDTICFGEGYPAHCLRLFSPQQYRLFNHASGDRHYCNIDSPGQMPAGESFKVTEIGLRVDMDGPIADDMLHALLRSLRLQLIVANKAYVTIPPGGFYPPGMTETVEGFMRRTEHTRDEIAGNGDRPKPLVAHCENSDGAVKLWADEQNWQPLSHVFFPSALGYAIAGRTQLGIQLRFANGRVWFEQSNDGAAWVDVTSGLSTNGYPFDTLESAEGYVRDFALSYDCRGQYLRCRWEPRSETNALRLSVTARGSAVLSSHDENDVEPPWLRGGFCRFVPVRPGIVLRPHESYSVELSFAGIGAQRMTAALAEGLLQGELAVLLGGVHEHELR